MGARGGLGALRAVVTCRPLTRGEPGCSCASVKKHLAVLGMVFAACAPETSVESDGYAQEATSAPTITFDAQWNERVQGTLVAGRAVRIAYDAQRLPGCRGEMYGRPAWSITGWMRVGDGAPQSFVVAPRESTAALTVDLPADARRVSFWFQNNSRWGCNTWDSNHGANYTFAVAPDPRAPDWMGDAAVVISRATCDGRGCDGDRRPLDPPWRYDTWARQRAAIRAVTFDVWEPGVTDFDNADLWRRLDVKVYFRYRANAPFAWRYVPFERRVGNNARFQIDLRGLDPMSDSPVPITACPDADLTAEPDGATVRATMEYYVTVNGVALRPAAGGAFRGEYINYRSALPASCVR